MTGFSGFRCGEYYTNGSTLTGCLTDPNVQYPYLILIVPAFFILLGVILSLKRRHKKISQMNKKIYAAVIFSLVVILGSLMILGSVVTLQQGKNVIGTTIDRTIAFLANSTKTADIILDNANLSYFKNQTTAVINQMIYDLEAINSQFYYIYPYYFVAPLMTLISFVVFIFMIGTGTYFAIGIWGPGKERTYLKRVMLIVIVPIILVIGILPPYSKMAYDIDLEIQDWEKNESSIINLYILPACKGEIGDVRLIVEEIILVYCNGTLANTSQCKSLIYFEETLRPTLVCESLVNIALGLLDKHNLYDLELWLLVATISSASLAFVVCGVLGIKSPDFRDPVFIAKLFAIASNVPYATTEETKKEIQELVIAELPLARIVTEITTSETPAVTFERSERDKWMTSYVT